MGAGRVSLAGPADVESNPDENTIALLNLKVPSCPILGAGPAGGNATVTGTVTLMAEVAGPAHYSLPLTD